MALLLALFIAGVPSAGTPFAQEKREQPEDATGRAEQTEVRATRHMVAAAHPDAARAGLKILRRGGSAVDAAAATQFVLALVEPQSSGIGGGTFLLHHDSASGRTVSYDGRETAPRAVEEDLFLDENGMPMKFFAAAVGGRAVGTPGMVSALALAHANHGKLPWAEILAPAIRLAREGFIVGPRLAAMLAGKRGELLRTFPETEAYFFPGGEPLRASERRTNPAFADTLEAIAKQGPSALLQGAIAEDIVAAVQGVAENPGLLSVDDLTSYRAVQRNPVCHPYRKFRICGMGPPSSGALALGAILGILEDHNLTSLGPANPLAWHLIAEASKIAFADRSLHVTDSDFHPVPVEGLLDREYLRERGSSVRTDSALPVPVAPGHPPGTRAREHDPDGSTGRPGTTHISVVDAEGNAVAMTSSIEGAFGSQLMVRGFLLNNQLTDFSFVPDRAGIPVANRVEPGKRPRSSMSPTIVFDETGAVRLVIGSPGGSWIIGYVAQTLIAVLDWKLNVQSAIDLGHVVNRNGATDLEAGTKAEKLAVPLEALGHEIRIRNLNSGLHGIEVVADGLRGGADPRREGIALGD